MSLFMRDSLGRLVPVNPGLPARRGNQGGMGRILSEAELMTMLPDADMAGMTGPGIVPGGEQAVGARRGALAQEAALPPAPTYRPLGGAQQNNRGNSRTVTLATNLGGPTQNIASVVETSKNTGDDAEVMTVQLGLDVPSVFFTPAYAGSPLDVVGIIQWGVGGAFFEAEVDWNQGVAIPLCASFVRVSARVSAIGVLGQPDIDIVLRASLAYGNAQSLNVSSAARRTINVSGIVNDFNLLPGETGQIAIPSWAMGFTVLDAGADPTANDGPGFPLDPDYTIELISSGTHAIAMWSLKSRSNLGSQVEGQFPVPPRAQFINLTNNLGVAVKWPKVMFNLGF